MLGKNCGCFQNHGSNTIYSWKNLCCMNNWWSEWECERAYKERQGLVTDHMVLSLEVLFRNALSYHLHYSYKLNIAILYYSFPDKWIYRKLVVFKYMFKFYWNPLLSSNMTSCLGYSQLLTVKGGVTCIIIFIVCVHD